MIVHISCKGIPSINIPPRKINIEIGLSESELNGSFRQIVKYNLESCFAEIWLDPCIKIEFHDDFLKKEASFGRYYCVVCGVNPVNVNKGYDTCNSCINSI